ncbi:hypothetical protein ACQVTS_29915 [Bacillus mycoides]|uniref:hypothetical protein n=1 Tax=Bacillus mycoides TaxID=1405 RepID=UPI003D661174
MLSVVERKAILAIMKISYLRFKNRLVFFFPFGDEIIRKKWFSIFLFFIVSMIYFIVYNTSGIIISYIPIDKILQIINILVFLFLLQMLRSSSGILQRYAHPEDYTIIFTAKTRPYLFLITRLFTSILLKITFNGFIILFPFLFFLLAGVSHPWKAKLATLLVLPFFYFFAFGLICVYSSFIYVIYDKYFSNVVNSVVKGFISFFFISLLSIFSTIFVGYIGINYIIEQKDWNDFFILLSEMNAIQFFSIDSYYLPTNWLLGSVLAFEQGQYGVFFILIISFFLLGCIFLLASIFLILKFVKVREPLSNNFSSPKGKVYSFISYIEKLDFLSQQVKAIFRKDMIALMRANIVIKRRIALSFYILATEIGTLIGIGTLRIWYEFPSFLLLYPILFAVIYNVSFIGDGLLGITSADAERENLYVYKQSGSSLIGLVISKGILHVGLIMIMANILFCGVIFALNLDVFTSLVSFIMINSIALLISVSQIVGTFLYPRLDWENIEDIGSSVKASLFEHVYLGICASLFLQLYGLLGVIYWKNIISWNTFCLSSMFGTLLMVVFSMIFFYFWIKRIGTKYWEVKR